MVLNCIVFISGVYVYVLRLIIVWDGCMLVVLWCIILTLGCGFRFTFVLRGGVRLTCCWFLSFEYELFCVVVGFLRWFLVLGFGFLLWCRKVVCSLFWVAASLLSLGLSVSFFA